ncbi:MAG: FG-GAP repeat protein [Minicystis sp.]
MNRKHISRLAVLVGILGAFGCAPEDGREDVGTAAQPLLGSANAQAFGSGFGTPDFGDGLTWFGTALASGDLDGDGTTDMVVGIPFAANGGAVDIFWGEKVSGTTPGGLANSRVTHLHQPGAGNPEAGDRFGSAVAVGDFNCDGHLDLAVGAPYDDFPTQSGGSIDAAGNVSILYGPDFTSSRWQLFWQGSAGIPGAPEAGDHFGLVLAVGNFNGDWANGHACDDLAIGTPDEGVGSASGAGAVTILYGRSTGLNTAGAPAPQLWHQDVGSVYGLAEEGDHFGQALAAGDFNGDGKDDLAIGAPFEAYDGVTGEVGIVHVLKGASGGLTDTGNYALRPSDFSGVSLQTAHFGQALARGDFDGDGKADLAVGAPFLSVGGNSSAGAVFVYRQIGGALSSALRYDQETSGVPGTAEAGDLCGFTLAAGDFDGNGLDDLASGCPGEGVTASGTDEGALDVVHFKLVTGALGIVSSQMWHKNASGIPGVCASAEWFSMSLAAGDFNGDGKADLSAGAYPGSTGNTGTVNVFYGAP